MSTLREATGADIVSLLVMAAPKHVLTDFGLDSPATAGFQEGLDCSRLDASATSSARLDYALVAAEAFYWATRKGRVRRALPLLARLTVPVDVLLALARRIEREEDKKRLAVEIPLLEQKIRASRANRQNVEARHSKRGGSRDKRANVQAEWASGRFKTRDQCATDCHAKVGLEWQTARDALKGTPDPAPWPGRAKPTRKQTTAHEQTRTG